MASIKFGRKTVVCIKAVKIIQQYNGDIAIGYSDGKEWNFFKVSKDEYLKVQVSGCVDKLESNVWVKVYGTVHMSAGYGMLILAGKLYDNGININKYVKMPVNKAIYEIDRLKKGTNGKRCKVLHIDGNLKHLSLLSDTAIENIAECVVTGEIELLNCSVSVGVKGQVDNIINMKQVYHGV